jgi:Lrp/AsnC family transcriptional regulator for asnA, asnC and gidA
METMKLAPADLDIIRCLHEDARSSVARMAERLGMPESTVRHRMNRLVRSRVIEFAAVTDPLKLGYQIWAILEIQAEMPKVRNVARRLAATPQVYFVGITTGSFDILAAAVFKSNEELLDFITHRLSTIPGIIRTSTSSILELVKRSMTIGLPGDVGAIGSRTPGARIRKPRKQTEGRHD